MKQTRPRETVHESMRQAVEAYLQRVKDIFRDHLESAVFFGRVLTDRFDARRDSAANVLTLKHVDLERLRSLAEQGRKLGARHVAAPWIMTRESIRSSLDTFPLELLEIQSKHVALIGASPFTELTFRPEHVRLQCEREFKRLTIQMRQGLLLATDMEFMLGQIGRGVGYDLIRALRGYLWLLRERRPVAQEDVIVRIEEIGGRDFASLRVAVDPAIEPTWEDFKALYEDLEILSALVDQLEGKDLS